MKVKKTLLFPLKKYFITTNMYIRFMNNFNNAQKSNKSDEKIY